jgi:hypothetical protein
MLQNRNVVVFGKENNEAGDLPHFLRIALNQAYGR